MFATKEQNNITKNHQNNGRSFFIQKAIYPKLTINQTGDNHEQEADAMAEKVITIPNIQRNTAIDDDTSTTLQTNPLIISTIQRKCNACKKEEEGQLQRKEDKEEILQMKVNIRRQEYNEASDNEVELVQTKSDCAGLQASQQLLNQLNASKGGGSPLPKTTNQFMSNAFGTDFSDVRVHTGQRAHQMNKGIGAKAFTHGSDIYFNKGQYSPYTYSGKQLLAHELSHFIQQDFQKKKSIQLQSDPELPPPGFLKPNENLRSTTTKQSQMKPKMPLNKDERFFVLNRELWSETNGIKYIYEKGSLAKNKQWPIHRNLVRVWVLGKTSNGKNILNVLNVEKSWLQPYSNAANGTVEKVTLDTTNDLYTDPNYKKINEIGIVYQEAGAKLRNAPLPGANLLIHLKQNEKVFILKENPNTKWYAVTTDYGHFGYVKKTLVWKNLPESNVKVWKIEKGKSAIGIAEKFYGQDFYRWGEDLRFVVNALAYANDRQDHNGSGVPGISKSEENSEKWSKAKTKADVYIWLPSVEFLNSLKGKVSSGSISDEIWSSVKNVLYKLAFGTAFIAGILHGAFDGLVALVKGLIDLIWGAIKSIFTGSVWNDLRNIFKAVTSMTLCDWKELFFGWMKPWLKKAESNNPFTSGHAYGYIAGRILFEILSLFIGGTAVAKVLSKLGKLASKLSKFKIIEKIHNGISKATGKVKKGIEKLKITKKSSQAVKIIYKVNARLRKKILWGINTTGNKVIGGHFRGIIGHPNYSIKIIGKSVRNPHCEIIKFTVGLPGNRVGKIKRSTLFPKRWRKDDIVKSIEQIANNPTIRSVDELNPAKNILQGKIKGTWIEVIIDKGKITSAYPL